MLEKFEVLKISKNKFQILFQKIIKKFLYKI